MTRLCSSIILIARGNCKRDKKRRFEFTICFLLLVERVNHNANNEKFLWGSQKLNANPIETRWGALRKSKPVTRWLLGNGNRKLVTQAALASGVSRKKGNSLEKNKWDRESEWIVLSVLFCYTPYCKYKREKEKNATISLKHLKIFCYIIFLLYINNIYRINNSYTLQYIYVYII